MRSPKGILLIVLPAVALTALYTWHRISVHKLGLDTYFRTGAGLRESASVAVDGVMVGSVDRIRIRPELGDHPVQVSITIRTKEPLVIPIDSIARLETQGVLGPTFVDIDTRQAVGSAIKNGETLKTAEFESNDSQAARAIEKIGTELVEQLKNARRTDGGPTTPSQH